MRKLRQWFRWLLSPTKLRAGERLEAGDFVTIKRRTVYRANQERQP
jgi:hypothetical protein